MLTGDLLVDDAGFYTILVHGCTLGAWFRHRRGMVYAEILACEKWWVGY